MNCSMTRIDTPLLEKLAELAKSNPGFMDLIKRGTIKDELKRKMIRNKLKEPLEKKTVTFIGFGTGWEGELTLGQCYEVIDIVHYYDHPFYLIKKDNGVIGQVAVWRFTEEVGK